MKLQVLVTLDITRLDAQRRPLPSAVVAGTPEHDVIVDAARAWIASSLDVVAKYTQLSPPTYGWVRIQTVETVPFEGSQAEKTKDGGTSMIRKKALPDPGCLRECRDENHQAQVNVSFEGCRTGSHSFYATTFDDGLRQLATFGVYVGADGVENAYWVPPWRIKKAVLMGTAPQQPFSDREGY